MNVHQIGSDGNKLYWLALVQKSQPNAQSEKYGELTYDEASIKQMQ